MSSLLHPTAIIHPGAQIDPSARVGPCSVIEDQVQIGPDCIIGPHVHLIGPLVLGAGNRVHAGCVLGDAPQDLKYKEERTRLVIGSHNVFREHVTVHRSNSLKEDTEIGSHNLLMAHSHVGHNARLGNHIVVANGALLGGHVVVQDRVFISGNCLVHQFVQIGTLALMQGGSGVSKDLPPYTIATGQNSICGLNSIGLRRAGFTVDQRNELKRIYHKLFRSGMNLRAALEGLKPGSHSPSARLLLEFVATSKRGVCTDISRRRSTASEASDESG